MNLTWKPFIGTSPIPWGLFYLAGYVTAKSDIDVVALMRCEETTAGDISKGDTIYCVDLQFAKEYKPEEITFTEWAEYEPPTHPDYKDTKSIEELSNQITEFLSYSDTTDPNFPQEASDLLELILETLEEF